MLSDIVDGEFVDDTSSIIDDSTKLNQVLEKLRIQDEEKALGEIALGFESWVSKELGLPKYDKKTIRKITKNKERIFKKILSEIKNRLPKNMKFDGESLCNALYEMKQPRLPIAHGAPAVTDASLQTKKGLEDVLGKYLKNENECLIGKAVLDLLCESGIKSEKKVIDKIRKIYDYKQKNKKKK